MWRPLFKKINSGIHTWKIQKKHKQKMFAPTGAVVNCCQTKSKVVVAISLWSWYISRPCSIANCAAMLLGRGTFKDQLHLVRPFSCFSFLLFCNFVLDSQQSSCMRASAAASLKPAPGLIFQFFLATCFAEELTHHHFIPAAQWQKTPCIPMLVF